MLIQITVKNYEPLPVKDQTEEDQLRQDLKKAVQNTLLRYGAGAQNILVGVAR